MIPFDNLDFDAVMAQSQAACAALSDNDGGLKREVLAHAGNRWSLGIVHNYQYAQHREAHERKLLADGNNGDGIREYVGLATRTCPVLEIFIAPCMSRMRRKRKV